MDSLDSEKGKHKGRQVYSGHKRVLNFVKQVFFLLSTEGSLVDTRAYLALHLGGTPSQETVTSPPRCQLLDNCLFMMLATIQLTLNNIYSY